MIEGAAGLSFDVIIAGVTVGVALVGWLAPSLLSVTVLGVSLSTIVGTAVVLGGLIALQFALRPKPPGAAAVPKPESGAQALRQAIAPRMSGYGVNRLAGYYMLYEATGANSYDVLALHSGKLGDGSVSSILRYYLHDDEVTVNTSNGLLSSVVVNADGRYADKVNIATRQGLATETAYPLLIERIPEIWTAAHRGDGIASLGLICTNGGADEHLKLFPHGKPEPSVAATCLQIWDPRDADQDPDDPDTWIAYDNYSSGTVYGPAARVISGGAVYHSREAANIGNDPRTSPTKWARVDTNPVLQFVDYLTNADHGMGLSRADIIDPVIDDLMAEADLCDALVLKKNGLYEPRYTSNGTFTFETDPVGVIGAMMATCDGWWGENNDGEVALTVGVYRAPSVTITHKHITGFTINAGVPDEDRINELTLSFTSESHQFKTVAGQMLRDEDEILAAGKTRSQGLDLTWVRDHSQARRLQKRALGRLKSPYRGSLTLTLFGMAVLGRRWVGLQYPELGIPALADAVIEIQPGGSVSWLDGKVTLNWLLIDPATIDAWDPDTEEGEGPPDADALAAVELQVPENIGGRAAGIDPEDGATLLHIWVDDPERPDLTLRLRYRIPFSPDPTPWADLAFGTATLADGRMTVFVNLPGDTLYEFQAAFRAPGGTLSDWTDSLFLTDLSPALDYSKPQNSAKWLFLNTF